MDYQKINEYYEQWSNDKISLENLLKNEESLDSALEKISSSPRTDENVMLMVSIANDLGICQTLEAKYKAYRKEVAKDYREIVGGSIVKIKQAKKKFKPVAKKLKKASVKLASELEKNFIETSKLGDSDSNVARINEIARQYCDLKEAVADFVRIKDKKIERYTDFINCLEQVTKNSTNRIVNEYKNAEYLSVEEVEDVRNALMSVLDDYHAIIMKFERKDGLVYAVPTKVKMLCSEVDEHIENFEAYKSSKSQVKHDIQTLASILKGIEKSETRELILKFEKNRSSFAAEKYDSRKSFYIEDRISKYVQLVDAIDRMIVKKSRAFDEKDEIKAKYRHAAACNNDLEKITKKDSEEAVKRLLELSAMQLEEISSENWPEEAGMYNLELNEFRPKLEAAKESIRQNLLQRCSSINEDADCGSSDLYECIRHIDVKNMQIMEVEKAFSLYRQLGAIESSGLEAAKSKIANLEHKYRTVKKVLEPIINETKCLKAKLKTKSASELKSLELELERYDEFKSAQYFEKTVREYRETVKSIQYRVKHFDENGKDEDDRTLFEFRDAVTQLKPVNRDYCQLLPIALGESCSGSVLEKADRIKDRLYSIPYAKTQEDIAYLQNFHDAMEAWADKGIVRYQLTSPTDREHYFLRLKDVQDFIDKSKQLLEAA
ncbi:hypothetical protein KY316_03175 [Candidatus Woesearchaeota archaeon]|nr:hypothetical protein [Candidatus Woesearchaeota archaeon]